MSVVSYSVDQETIGDCDLGRVCLCVTMCECIVAVLLQGKGVMLVG